MTEYVWLITATSSGFGKAIALEALSRGHKVIATARDSSQLTELKTAGAAVLDLDVTASDETLAAKFAEAKAIYGKITHVANCAGYPLSGPVEAASNEEVFKQFNTNVLGTFNIARAAVPHLREAAAVEGQSAAILNFGSLGSWTSMAAMAHYCSTKWAVSGMTEGLYDELKPFGINVCLVEPGYTRTEFLTSAGGRERLATAAKRLPVYDGTSTQQVLDAMTQANGNQPGDVKKCAKVILDVITKSGVAEGREIPMRLMLGSDTVATVRGKCESTLKLLEEWEEVACYVDY